MTSRNFALAACLATACALVGCSSDTAEPTDTGADTADDVSVDVEIDTAPQPRPYPAPDAWGPNTGPGGPAATFTTEELFVNCAFLDGGADDYSDHHNLVTMYDGYLLMPWAPEYGRGGFTFFDISDPCAPEQVGYGFSDQMRETHSIGFSDLNDGRWAVVNGIDTLLDGGIQIWDISDITTPVAVADVFLEGFFYPDAYARVTLSVFWQGTTIYAAGADNGLYIIDASDPMNPVQVGLYPFEPVLRAGQVQAIGNLLIVTAAEDPRVALLDISDPLNPQPIPGGDFLIQDSTGAPVEAYFSNFANGYSFHARKSDGGGIIIYDLHDPTQPTYVNDYHSDGNGGYVFIHEDYAFVGESRFGALYDISDMMNITEVNRFELIGDLDTVTPIGNIAFVAVDDEATPDQGTAAAPWTEQPDTNAPHVSFVWPADGTDSLPITSRIGLSFNENIDVLSAFAGSVRLYETGTDPELTRVDGHINVQEVIVNFSPVEPLNPATEYTLEVPAGGIVDFSGNAIEEPFTMTFSTL